MEAASVDRRTRTVVAPLPTFSARQQADGSSAANLDQVELMSWTQRVEARAQKAEPKAQKKLKSRSGS